MDEATPQETPTSRLIIPSLVISRALTALPTLVTGLLLIDIGRTFNTPVGISGQIRTASSAISILFALSMGFLSIRYRHKPLLVTGLLIYSLSAVTCGLAPNFTILLGTYALNGLGFALVNPMVNTLIGELLPVEKRTSVIGYTVAAMALFYVTGSLLTSYIAELAGWRWAFMGLVFPVSALSLILALKAIPSIESTVKMGTSDVKAGFEAMLSNRSAVACVLGTALGITAWNFYLTYGASFWRQQYQISTMFVSIAMILTSLSYISGSLLCGRVVKKLGRIKLVIFSALLLGLATILVTYPTNFWYSYVIGIIASFCAGLMITSFTSLTLEQIPRFRGTMMSVYSAATSLGQLICASLGGFLLLRYGYNVLGIGLGVAGVLSSLVIYGFAVDPTKKL
jgi:DHA1 family bicyclomycin/chloramphenicol resistance-like MFS transporter